MNWYHKLLITLLVGLFLFNHQDVIVDRYRDNSPVLTSEQITNLDRQVLELSITANEKIKSGTYSAEQWQSDVYFLRGILNGYEKYYNFRFYIHAQKTIDFTTENYYRPKSMDRVNSLLFQQEVNSAQAKILHNNNVGVDWSKIISGIWSFYLSFMLFTFLIILIKRSVGYKFKFHSAGDIVVVILCTLLSILGIFVYKPNSLLQKTIDAELRVWQQKIGTRGWRLGLAYMLAIFFALSAILRPIKIYAQEFVQSKVVITQMVELEYANESLEFNLPIVAIVRSYLIRIIRAIQKYIFLFFSPMFILLNIPPPRSFIMISWSLPRDRIALDKMIVGCRAPSVLVQFNTIDRTINKHKGIYSEKYHFNINNLFSS